MGSSVAAAARAGGSRVVWASAGRGEATRKRAEAAGLEDVGPLVRLPRESEIIVCVCPPASAPDVAREVAATRFGGTFVDGNAIAPATTRAVGEIVTAGGARFVDGGIIGPPPRKAGEARLYLSGPGAAAVAAVFNGTTLEAIVLDRPIGAASTRRPARSTGALRAGRTRPRRPRWRRSPRRWRHEQRRRAQAATASRALGRGRRAQRALLSRRARLRGRAPLSQRGVHAHRGQRRRPQPRPVPATRAAAARRARRAHVPRGVGGRYARGPRAGAARSRRERRPRGPVGSRRQPLAVRERSRRSGVRAVLDGAGRHADRDAPARPRRRAGPARRRRLTSSGSLRRRHAHRFETTRGDLGR